MSRSQNLNVIHPSMSLGFSRSSITSNYGSSTGFHNLSINILVNIFQYFNENELRETIGLVCKRWRYASIEPQLWKKLEFRGKKVSTTLICRKIKDMTFIKSIIIDDIADPIATIRQIYRYHPNIKHLAITNCSSIPESTLRHLILRCRTLESLNFSGTRFRANKFYEEIAGLKHLKSVNLSKNSWLSVHNLLTVTLNCHKLEELHLSSFCPLQPQEQFSDKDASFIVSNLASNLKVLLLDANTLTNFSFSAILKCNNLQQLGLYGAGNLSPETFTELWKYFPNLQVLKIRQAHQISGQHVAKLFDSGRSVMQNVVFVDFTGCWKITDIGIEALAECCVNLHTLILKCCKTVHSLQKVGEKCQKLEKLNVAFCTSLNFNTILPFLKTIKVLIIDKNHNFSNITEALRSYNSKTLIKLCLSEYNKQMETYRMTNIERYTY